MQDTLKLDQDTLFVQVKGLSQSEFIFLKQKLEDDTDVSVFLEEVSADCSFMRQI
jgi:hypothetical protein